MENETDSEFELTLTRIRSWRDAIDEADAATKARLMSAWKEEILDSFVEVLKECNGPVCLFVLHGHVESMRGWKDKNE